MSTGPKIWGPKIENLDTHFPTLLAKLARLAGPVRSLTFDGGSESAKYALIESALGGIWRWNLRVESGHPHSDLLETGTWTPINSDRIIGAVNVYLLLALAGALTLEVIHAMTGASLGGNVALSGKDEDYAKFICFSLASLTTVGFGDIYAVNTAARMVATLLSTLGATDDHRASLALRASAGTRR
jgi:hypothetical protein